MTQKEAIDILKMGHSVFLTGAAGTGKTFVLNEYIKYLKSHNISPIITASTGIASTHIGGQTIHSWSGIGILDKLDKYQIDKLSQNEKLYAKYKNAKVLIIDEISMLHASRLDMINILFKKFLNTNKAFGGIQVIFCGDFFQLPPIVKYNNFSKEENQELNFSEAERKEFAFNSQTWKEINPIICYLSENFRQENDEKLLYILNNLRQEKDIENIYDILNQKINFQKNKEDLKDVIKLYTHNLDIDLINNEKYNSLSKENKEYIYEMKTKGKHNLVENLKKNCLAPEILKLKIGTKIIFIKNDQFKKYQNGTLGEIVGFEYENPIIELKNKKQIKVEAESWQMINEDGKIMAEISQLPIRYAWAITIHKSQGMTLDAAEIDLSKAFGSGMGYVALSRVRNLENINLIGIKENALKIDKHIILQDKIFQEKSKKAGESLEKYYQEKEYQKELIKKHENFILACEGDLNEIEIEIENPVYEEKSKIKTIYITLPFIKEEKLEPEKIAEKRELTIGTIISHIEELVESKILILEDIKYIIEKIEKKYSPNQIKNIQKILKEEIKLKDKILKLNNDFNIKIDYNNLRLLKLKYF